MSTAIIEAHDLCKHFAVRRSRGRFRRERVIVEAVSNISLRVEPGEIVGYLGPNGAGKSTTIKMMSGILAPTSGCLTVAGLTPLTDRRQLARRIGVVFGQRSNLWWDLALRDSFDLLAKLHQLGPDLTRQQMSSLTDTFELGPLLEVPVRQLSLGQRMRAELAAALLHQPSLLFLDEPTIGLDVVSKHAVRAAVIELQRQRGTTVVLTTHDLGDVERLCQRVVIIDHGRVISDGLLDDLVRLHQPYRTLIIDLEQTASAATIERLRADGLDEVHSDGPRHSFRFDPERISAAAAIARVAAEVQVRDLTIEEPEIEEIIRQIYSKDR